jgi:hypothetical protein
MLGETADFPLDEDVGKFGFQEHPGALNDLSDGVNYRRFRYHINLFTTEYTENTEGNKIQTRQNIG